jgi:hypothetical protein
MYEALETKARIARQAGRFTVRNILIDIASSVGNCSVSPLISNVEC